MIVFAVVLLFKCIDCAKLEVEQHRALMKFLDDIGKNFNAVQAKKNRLTFCPHQRAQRRNAIDFPPAKSAITIFLHT